MKEACMRENGCQCECPIGKSRGGKKVTVEDVKDEYDGIGGLMVGMVRGRYIKNTEESDETGGVMVGG